MAQHFVRRTTERGIASSPSLGVLFALTMGYGCHRQLEQPRRHTEFVTGMAPWLAEDLVAYYNQALPSLDLSLQRVAGEAAVASSLHDGRGDIGIAQQADVIYTAYRRGVGENSSPYSDLRGVAV